MNRDSCLSTELRRTCSSS